MSLKKSDKVIAIVGILILVIAAVGIIFYYSEEPTEESPGTVKEKQFIVEWEQLSGDLPTITEFVGKNEEYFDPINVDLDEGCVLGTVNINFNWQDDFVLKLALPGRKGEDTLTAKVYTEGDETEPYISTGSGNHTFDFVINDIIPQDFTIEDAVDQYDAEQRVLENYSGMNSAHFNTSITVKTGEKIRLVRLVMRILNKLRDTGNGFYLNVNYTYYKPIITEKETDNDDIINDTSETDYADSYYDYIKNTSHGRDI